MFPAVAIGSSNLTPASQLKSTPYAPKNGPQPGEASAELSSPTIFPCPYSSADPTNLSDWPSEISSAMEWSIRFLDYPHFQSSDLSLPTTKLN
jgi:hypothetical protein